jgi:hypothetical protein
MKLFYTHFYTLGLNAVGVHTELNGTGWLILPQMPKGTPCLLYLSPFSIFISIN